MFFFVMVIKGFVYLICILKFGRFSISNALSIIEFPEGCSLFEQHIDHIFWSESWLAVFEIDIKILISLNVYVLQRRIGLFQVD